MNKFNQQYRRQVEKRKNLVELMMELHGTNYTLGWLKGMYTHSFDLELENVIVEDTLNQLMALKATRSTL